MEMRQNSNEVKKKKEKKETRICVQVDNKSNLAVCLKIGLFLSLCGRRKNLCLTQFRVTFERKSVCIE